MLKFIELLTEEKIVTIDVDYVPNKDTEKINKKYKVKAEITGDTTADITGKKSDIIKWLKYNEYDDIEELYPELF